MHQGLPEVHDEAGDSPRWVSLVGLALLVAIALFFAYRLASPAPEVGDAAAEVVTADAPAAEPAPAAQPAVPAGPRPAPAQPAPAEPGCGQ